MNCWEFKKCGCEGGGDRVAVGGVCPAFSKNAGQACWLVSGTLCDVSVQGSYSEKKTFCHNCDFFQRIQALQAKLMPVRAGREGEVAPPAINRSNRVYQSGGDWYFTTREGVVLGPYHSRIEASDAVQDFIDFMGSASEEMIARFLGKSCESQG